MNTQNLLKNRTALVTGSSRGIGKCIAQRLAVEGVHVILSASSEKLLEQAVSQIESDNGMASYITCDLSNIKEVHHLADQVNSRFGKLDILINNAGTSVKKPFYETSDNEWTRLMTVNATAPFILCRECLPLLKQSDAATIINIGSVVGIKGYESQSAYTASKHALMGFTKVLAQEVQPLGIRVHALNPGGVDTDMVETMRPDIDKSKLIQPDDIADIILFLLNHRNNAAIDDIHIRRTASSPWF